MTIAEEAGSSEEVLELRYPETQLEDDQLGELANRLRSQGVSIETRLREVQSKGADLVTTLVISLPSAAAAGATARFLIKTWFSRPRTQSIAATLKHGGRVISVDIVGNSVDTATFARSVELALDAVHSEDEEANANARATPNGPHDLAQNTLEIEP